MKDKAERWQSVLAALLARADHPATPPAEAELARSKALQLAGKYTIEMPGVASGELRSPILSPSGHADVPNHHFAPPSCPLPHIHLAACGCPPIKRQGY